MPPRGTEAVPQGRALPDGQVRGGAPLLSARRARTRAHETERVPAAAAREAEGAPLLRRAGEAVPRLLRKGLTPAGRHRREPAGAARVPPGQRAGTPGLRRIAPPGPTAHPPRPLDGQRPAGG